MIATVAGRTLQVQTPEGVVFHFGIAGLFTRFLAWSVDVGVVLTAASLLGTVTTLFKIINPDVAAGFSVLSYFVISVGYGIFTEWQWRGQSWGKRILRIRVIDASGLKLQFSQIVIRNLLRPVDLLPLMYLLGGAIAFCGPRGQRLGDLAANTVVINTPEPFNLQTEQLQASKYNSFRDYPHLEARLRQRTTPAEAALALDALLRRDEITPEARLELFRQLSDHFRALVPFEEKIDETMAGEQFVRNVVASLYRKPGGKMERPAPTGSGDRSGESPLTDRPAQS